jgi:hypothetical protein
LLLQQRFFLFGSKNTFLSETSIINAAVQIGKAAADALTKIGARNAA